VCRRRFLEDTPQRRVRRKREATKWTVVPSFASVFSPSIFLTRRRACRVHMSLCSGLKGAALRDNDDLPALPCDPSFARLIHAVSCHDILLRVTAVLHDYTAFPASPLSSEFLLSNRLRFARSSPCTHSLQPESPPSHRSRPTVPPPRPPRSRSRTASHSPHHLRATCPGSGNW
jgi:hypothetical protein